MLLKLSYKSTDGKKYIRTIRVSKDCLAEFLNEIGILIIKDSEKTLEEIYKKEMYLIEIKDLD